MNRKIAMSMLSIVAALTLMGGATYAQFASSALSDNNTFATGNADLKIAPDVNNGPGTYAAFIPGFSATGNIFPGYTQNFKFWLKNTSTTAIDLSNIARFVDVQGTGFIEPLQDALQVTFTCTRIGDSVVTTAGPFSVNAWEAGQAPVGTLLGGNVPASEAQCVMNASLPLSADNTVQNSTVRFDAQFDATQVAP